MEYLSKLFGSPARVKILRLFLFCPTSVFDRDTIVERARVTPETASKELAALDRALLITRKNFYKEVVRPGTGAAKKRKTVGWVLDLHHPHIAALTRFMRDTLSVSHDDLRKRLRGVGTIRLLALAGALVGDKDGSLDMLIVGDKLDEQAARTVVRSLEAEFGVELRYAMLTTEDYKYRRRVRDKLVRDVLDFSHELLIDRVVE